MNTKNIEIPKAPFAVEASFDGANWDDQLMPLDHSIFICSDWLKSVSSDSRTPIYLNFSLDGTIMGKIAGLVDKKGILKGDQLYFYSAIALIDNCADTYKRCLKALLKYSKENNFSRIKIGSYGNTTSFKYETESYYTNSRTEYTIPLKEGLSHIKLGSRFKRNVKKGQKEKITVSKSSDPKFVEQLFELLDSTKETRKAKYQKDYDPMYLQYLNKECLLKLLESGAAKIHFTRNGDEISCMEFNVEINNSVYMLLKGATTKGYTTGAPSLLSHHLIHSYIEDRFTAYNQGGRPEGKDGDGLAVFKKSAGAEEIATHGASTNYLTYPYKLLNPIINAVRSMPHNKFSNALRKLQ